MAQKVDGYAWMRRNIQKYFRAVDNPGVVDDDVIADGITVAERMIHDEILASRIHWCVKSKTIDDLGGDLGSDYDFKVRRLFIEEDLGITDFAKAVALWRVDSNQGSVPQKLFYLPDGEDGNQYIRAGGSLVGATGEYWTEHSDFNASGDLEQAFLMFNWGVGKENGQLRVVYWWTPSIVETSVFTETDANGDLISKPPFPRPMWVYLLEYAKWVITEVTGDIDKNRALARRWKSRGGIQERVREFLGQFQTAGPEYVHDNFLSEG